MLLPSFSGSEDPARLAWCYGCLGVALVMDRMAAKFPQIEERLALLTIGCLEQLQNSRSRIEDAFLCHGHAGAALIFSVLSRSLHLSNDLRSACGIAASEQIAIAL